MDFLEKNGPVYGGKVKNTWGLIPRAHGLCCIDLAAANKRFVISFSSLE